MIPELCSLWYTSREFIFKCSATIPIQKMVKYNDFEFISERLIYTTKAIQEFTKQTYCPLYTANINLLFLITTICKYLSSNRGGLILKPPR